MSAFAKLLLKGPGRLRCHRIGIGGRCASNSPQIVSYDFRFSIISQTLVECIQHLFKDSVIFGKSSWDLKRAVLFWHFHENIRAVHIPAEVPLHRVSEENRDGKLRWAILDKVAKSKQPRHTRQRHRDRMDVKAPHLFFAGFEDLLPRPAGSACCRNQVPDGMEQKCSRPACRIEDSLRQWRIYRGGYDPSREPIRRVILALTHFRCR